MSSSSRNATAKNANAEDTQRIEAERLSAVLQMISGLAHESRNAIQRAQSCLELLELGASDDEEQQKLTASIHLALADLHQTYEDVKTYATPIKLTYSLTDLKQLCQSVFDEVAGSVAGKRASLDFIEKPPCGKTMVDSTQLRLVLRNVFRNAIAASDNDTRIEVHCHEIELDDQPAIEIRIRDHGSGLDSSIKSQLFEPFVTTKQRGVGLGLATSRRIVKAHGGEINIANHPGGGVEVQVLIPR
ncbi:Sensor protein FixL [Roseimaritima multifibrata]|uniref:histidine kinase n=1 Tax=Roseimaritima multifibrata TaxID=1930274 RepID=A0A517MA45_9BACT|nr:HAMP domain-containing sensor histidine kinase [Roseimaritima multifibrata]QDS91758.1 Sensor protein FixL [Roseimaritima multifibrata]